MNELRATDRKSESVARNIFSFDLFIEFFLTVNTKSIFSALMLKKLKMLHLEVMSNI